MSGERKARSGVGLKATKPVEAGLARLSTEGGGAATLPTSTSEKARGVVAAAHAEASADKEGGASLAASPLSLESPEAILNASAAAGAGK